MHMKRFFRKGTEHEFRFLFGIIIAAVVIFAFARCTIGFLKGSDASLETFNALGNVIDDLQAKTSSETQTVSQMVHIEPGQPWYFFDKGTDYAVAVYTNINLDEFKTINFDIFGISGTHYDLKYFLKKKTYCASIGGVYVYSKPKACGDDACMVICKQPRIKARDVATIKLPEPTGTLNLEWPLSLVDCESAEVKTFKSVEHFYRKPAFVQTYYASAPTPCASTVAFTPGAVLETFQFIGHLITLQHNYDFDKPAYETTTPDPDRVRLVITEYSDGTSFKERKLMDSDVIYIQSFNKKILICYTYPCLTSREEFYLLWLNNIFGPCWDEGKCSALEERILSIPKTSAKQELTFERVTPDAGNVGLRVTVNNNKEGEIPESYGFAREIPMRAYKSGEAIDKGTTIDKISFSMRKLSDGKKVVVMKFNEQEKTFISVSSTLPKAEGEKTIMNFKYEDLPPETTAS